MCCILYAERGFVFVDVETDKTAVLNNDVIVNVLQWWSKEVLSKTEKKNGNTYLDT